MDSPLAIEKQKIAQLGEMLSHAHKIALTAHRNADGDAVGSLLGTYHILSAMGKEAYIMLPNGCPSYFEWLRGEVPILDATRDLERCEQLLCQECDLIICLDFNRLNRVEALEPALRRSTLPKILIDHHIGPEAECFNLLFSFDISSASELVYWVFASLLGDEGIPQAAARAIYTGITTDTGSFHHSCDSPSVYLASAALVAKGINAAEIHSLIDNVFTLKRMQFFAFALSQRFHVFEERHFAYIYVTMEDMERFGVTAEDTEGLVNYTTQLKEVTTGVFLREEASRIKVSMRSKGNVCVREVAEAHFHGGGHNQAAGGDWNGSMESCIEELKSIYLS